jgi:hypothetical protein
VRDQGSTKKIHLPVIIAKTCEDPVNDQRVVADEIAVVLLKAKLQM